MPLPPRWTLALAACLAFLPALGSAQMPAQAKPSLSDEVTRLVAAGRAHEALQRAELALQASPRDAQTRFVHAVVLMELQRDAQALAAFSQLAQEFPELPEPLNNIALLQVRAGRLDAARATLEAALRNDPGHRAARANLAEVHLMLARAAWEQLAQSGPLDASLARRLDAVKALLAAPPSATSEARPREALH